MSEVEQWFIAILLMISGLFMAVCVNSLIGVPFIVAGLIVGGHWMIYHGRRN